MLHLPGVTEVKYHPHADYFTVQFDSAIISLESIFAKVAEAGKQRGREYLPEVITDPEPIGP
jgi:copper chaperone CopZ